MEEERFAREVEIHLGLSAEIEAAQGQIFYVKNEYGEERSALAQAEELAECGRIQENAQMGPRPGRRASVGARGRRTRGAVGARRLALCLDSYQRPSARF